MYFRDFKITKEEIIKGDRFMDITENTSLCYVKTDVFVFNRQIEFRGKIHPMKITKYLISGHADHSVDERVFNMHKDKFDLWFSTNVDYKDKKLIPIPIGITNLLPEYGESEVHKILGNLDMMIDVLEEPKKDDKLVYMNISVNTYPKERQLVYELLHDKKYVTTASHVCSMEGRKEFLRQIRNHKFCICPRGNGIDTHRLWEALYMGTIPITKKVTAYEDFIDLPILFVDDWSEVTEEFLNKKYEEIHNKRWNMLKLTMSYWKNKIYRMCNIDNKNKYEINNYNYEFIQGVDVMNHEILKINTRDINILKKMCNENDNCIGFNSYGYLKYKGTNEIKMINLNKSDSGFYLKKDVLIPELQKIKIEKPNSNFIFFKSFDIIGSDISVNKNASNEEMKKICNDIPEAYAFNTLGYIKGKFDINKLEKSQFYDSNDGIYIDIEKYYRKK
jgi:hypothetical protein